MRPRQLIVLILAGMLLLIGAMSAAERDLRSREALTPTTRSTMATPSAPVREPATIRATMPDERTVKAQVGDTVELSVRSDTPDVAKILALGVKVAVGPGIPGQATFQALAAGRYAVQLELADRDAGVIVVREPDGDRSG